ncbi:hypothetical protein [Streptomyces chartreusis]|uniref:hypothetical protein n=1 Tax=Streptomyces chartreusis TaxID=1969 RepID=UPI003668C395
MSFIQARPMYGWAHTDESLAHMVRAGYTEVPLDDFFDAEVERRAHIRRVALEGLSLKSEGMPGGEWEAEASVHATIWSIGFAVWRVTVCSDGVRLPRQAAREWIAGLHALEHELPDGPVAEWRFLLDDQEHVVRGNVRRLFDYLGFAAHEFMLERPIDPDLLQRWSYTGVAARQRASELVDSGENAYIHPATFGTHMELLWTDARRVGPDPSRWAPGLMGFAEDSELESYTMDASHGRYWWFMREFQSLSVSVVQDGEMRPRNGVWEQFRVQLIEYLALRRGVLRSIQRETFRVAAERAPLARRRVSEWLWLMSVAMDEYVLAGWQAARFERMKVCFQQAASLRDMTTLESQVRLNIEAFQGRLDAESDRAGVAAAVLFGIVAATALVPGGQVAARSVLGLDGSFEDFPFIHPLAYLALTAGLLAVMALVGWGLLRRVRWLRPPRPDRGKGRLRRTRTLLTPVLTGWSLSPRRRDRG